MPATVPVSTPKALTCSEPETPARTIVHKAKVMIHAIHLFKPLNLTQLGRRFYDQTIASFNVYAALPA